jgi:hypothetical protein
MSLNHSNLELSRKDEELEAVLTGFSAEFYQKDCQAIHNFFDIDKNNTLNI